MIQCDIADFVSRHRKELGTIASFLASSEDASLVKMRETVNKVLADAAQARGRKNCWALGDVLIAVCAPSEAPIYTTNRQHFEPICEALGKTLFDG